MKENITAEYFLKLYLLLVEIVLNTLARHYTFFRGRILGFYNLGVIYMFCEKKLYVLGFSIFSFG